MRTPLTDLFGLDAPVIAAPMAGAAGGALASAVSKAGGLGLVGGGYGDADWLRRELTRADAPVGVGLITWALSDAVLALALDSGPRAILLSFGDPMPFAPAIRGADVPLICQVQSVAHACRALDAGAAVLVAQGGEAGGHGATRGTLSLVAEVVDLAGDVPVVAAGGIADGRGLAAALMLGAAGAMLGSRFWAATEALVADGLVDAALAADGDRTVKGGLPDAARLLHWPEGYAVRTLATRFSADWQGREEDLRNDDGARQGWADAMASGDAGGATPIVGEAVGLFHARCPAGRIVADLVAEARECLARGARLLD